MKKRQKKRGMIITRRKTYGRWIYLLLLSIEFLECLSIKNIRVISECPFGSNTFYSPMHYGTMWMNKTSEIFAEFERFQTYSMLFQVAGFFLCHAPFFFRLVEQKWSILKTTYIIKIHMCSLDRRFRISCCFYSGLVFTRII